MTHEDEKRMLRDRARRELRQTQYAAWEREAELMREAEQGRDAAISEVLTATRAGLIPIPVQGEAWDGERRYIEGDEVAHNGETYIAQRFSRNKEPGTLCEYWAVKPGVVRPEWSSIEDGTVIYAGTEVVHEGVAYRCISQHIKSTVYRPKTGSSKWEVMTP